MAKVVTEASAGMRLLRALRPHGCRVRRAHGPVACETMGGALYVINRNFAVLAVADSNFGLLRALGLARRGEVSEIEPPPRRRRRAAARGASKSPGATDLASRPADRVSEARKGNAPPSTPAASSATGISD
jgi:hypothetical protein